MGRICQEKDVNNTIIINYTYDDYGQLIREDNKILDKTFVYEYNNIGNIVNVKTLLDCLWIRHILRPKLTM